MTVEAYPLQWPAGWKRASAGSRKSAKFNRFGKSLTIEQAVTRIRAELQRMGVRDDDLVISTNLKLRLDGLPRSDQREPDDPGAAVYWRDGTAMRCMAIDRYDRAADNLAAIAATLDAMRAIERHGGAEILDRAYAGFSALPPPITGEEPWYVVLDVDPDEAHEVVEKVYRWLRSDNHPDRGGDASQFDRVQRAWESYLEQRG